MKGIFRFGFGFSCFAAALGMTIYWCFKFWQDEDLCLVDFKTFSNSKDVQTPVLSFCFWNPIEESRLKLYNDTFTKKDYIAYLSGKKYFNGMEKVSFDEVTINLSTFYRNNPIRFRNGTFILSKTFLSGSIETTFSGWFGPKIFKCFGLPVKHKESAEVWFNFGLDMFPNGIRPGPWKDMQPSTFIHQPNALLLSGDTYKHIWPKRETNSSFFMSFVLTNIDVLKRRNKRNQPCVEGQFNFDQEAFNKHGDKFGCKPPYLNMQRNQSVCHSRENIKQSVFDMTSLNPEELKVPCNTYENVNFRFLESDFSWSQRGNPTVGEMTVGFKIPERFKEISQVKAVDIQTVIGNAGGYVGLFLGNQFNY